MKIVSFIYCEEVNSDQDGRNTLLNPMQMLTPVALPSNYSFTISFGVFDFNKDIENAVVVSFVKPNGDVLAENNMSLPVLPTETKSGSTPFGVQFNIGFVNVILDVEGEYHTSININGENLGDYPIYVVKGNVYGD